MSGHWCPVRGMAINCSLWPEDRQLPTSMSSSFALGDDGDTGGPMTCRDSCRRRWRGRRGRASGTTRLLPWSSHTAPGYHRNDPSCHRKRAAPRRAPTPPGDRRMPMSSDPIRARLHLLIAASVPSLQLWRTHRDAKQVRNDHEPDRPGARQSSRLIATTHKPFLNRASQKLLSGNPRISARGGTLVVSTAFGYVHGLW